MKHCLLLVKILGALCLYVSVFTLSAAPAKPTFGDWVKSWVAWFKGESKEFAEKKLSKEKQEYYGYAGPVKHPTEVEYYGYYESKKGKKPELFGFYGYYETKPGAKPHEYYEYYKGK